ncbi:uncharacterized protein Dwil_GK11817 [Drosophila willistoni]|uniref:tRNA (uracil-O(2)-)-methyltransferase n=1 Tax=Drosophila willistoni TaxID=7260 RepID=B4NB25_DROWI|nr:probable tRNA (uracil-O(2)-)-methyltransferase [Drosophila willistoni]EDW80989.1 uncharacterized protein Dwil_GK11817 [Drosophila willistoni]
MSAVITEPQFFRGIDILIKNYHALNKQIFAVVITQVRKQQNGNFSDSTEEELEDSLLDHSDRGTCTFEIGYKLLTKKIKENMIGTGILDFDQKTYQCKFNSEELDDFCVRLKDGEVEASLLETGSKSRWLEFVLMPKLLSWCQSHREKGDIKSLGLVDVEKYNNLYKDLKTKHAQTLLEYWQEANESTDPLKFIYEDLAIAAYLIILWSETQTEPRAFADLGCGNGLLVHILNAEGYEGYGYDIRKRKLWSLYNEQTQSRLIEQAVEPKSFSLASPHIDWLIGNHSDELSPWLPVLAARFNTKFFLLPCCAFELSGLKFQRRNTGISAYQDFYKYATNLSKQCGFDTLQDRLKIPSTKRLALIGLKRESRDYENIVKEELEKFKTSDELCVKIRQKEETVRNCTQVEKSIIDSLVLKIFRLLLNNNEDHWSGRLSMRIIAQNLTRDELKGIKSECGGIKTLLRNKHEVFEFCGNDLIGIRKPMNSGVLSHKLTAKKRQCFFRLHHPLGCPLKDSDCSFIH